MKRLFAFTLFCSACATSAKPPIQVQSRFDPQEVAWFSQAGSNTIRGSAVLRTVGGDVKTCGGLKVSLVPVSTYALERVRRSYGSDQRGYMPARKGVNLVTPPPGYLQTTKETRCDADGDFTFPNLPDGDYFVVTMITWGIPTRYFTRTEGGHLMQRVRLAGGQTAEVVLTAD